MSTAQDIARTTLHVGGRRGTPGEVIGMEPQTVSEVCTFLGLTETPWLYTRLWELLGAFEDGALQMIHKLPKDERGYVSYEGEDGLFS